MPRGRTGTIWFDEDRQQWRGRTSFTNPVTRRRVERYVSGATKTGVRDELKRILRSLDDKGPERVARERLTWRELAELYRVAKLQPATIVDGRKVAGLKNTVSPSGWLDMLTAHFGDTPLTLINLRALEEFRLLRLKTPTQHGRQRKTATLNRELQFFARVLNYAVAHGYLERNPFQGAAGLIQRSKENKRERVLTFGEELVLLEVCRAGGNDKRGHLRAIIVLLADTGLRRNELLTLEWRDVQIDTKRLFIRAENAKTEQAREIPLTARALAELHELRAAGTGQGRVFSISNFRKAFNTACRLAQVPDLHAHDLRHTFITRAMFAGIPKEVVLKSSGHHSDEWKRYLNVTPDGLRALFRLLPGQDEQAVKTFGVDVLNGLKTALGWNFEDFLCPAFVPQSVTATVSK